MLGLIASKWRIFAVAGGVIAVFLAGYKMASDRCAAQSVRATMEISMNAAEHGREVLKRQQAIKDNSLEEETHDETSKPEYDCVVPADGVRLSNRAKANR